MRWWWCGGFSFFDVAVSHEKSRTARRGSRRLPLDAFRKYNIRRWPASQAVALCNGSSAPVPHSDDASSHDLPPYATGGGGTAGNSGNC